MVALRRTTAMLQPGGRLYPQDVVFSFAPDGHVRYFDTLLEDSAEYLGPDVAHELVLHIRDEYSTLD